MDEVPIVAYSGSVYKILWRLFQMGELKVFYIYPNFSEAFLQIFGKKIYLMKTIPFIFFITQSDSTHTENL